MIGLSVSFLPHSSATLRMLACTLTLSVVLASAPRPAGSAETDRLERFRQLAASRLSTLELSGLEPSAEVFRELYALLDEEVLDSLEAGGVFASDGFLQ